MNGEPLQMVEGLCNQKQEMSKRWKHISENV
jgi:hypothetical protein